MPGWRNSENTAKKKNEKEKNELLFCALETARPRRGYTRNVLKNSLADTLPFKYSNVMSLEIICAHLLG